MINKILQNLEIEYGIPQSVFQKYDFLIQKEQIFIMNKVVYNFNKIRPYRKGILFAQKFGKTIKISDQAIQIFGKYATKNIVELSSEQMSEIIKAKKITNIKMSLETSQKDFLLTYKKYPVGLY
ncbi:MAG: hypothetical protein N2201_05500 [candidate division WOR-3 bacterium]|nr:hypothetical protein [candidate division WOR-3 bacterium]